MGTQAVDEVEFDPNEAITLTRATITKLQEQAWEAGYAEGLKLCKHGRRE